MKRFLMGLGVALLVAGAIGATPQSSSPTALVPAPGEEGPLVAEGPPPDLVLIYTGGVVGYVEPCG